MILDSKYLKTICYSKNILSLKCISIEDSLFRHYVISESVL